MSALQDRLKAEADKNGSVTLHNAAEHAAARSLERRGLVKIDNRSTGGVYGGNKDQPFVAWSQAEKWVGPPAHALPTPPGTVAAVEGQNEPPWMAVVCKFANEHDKIVSSQKSCFSRCREISTKLAEILDKANIDAKVIRVSEGIARYPEADPRWHKLESPFWWVHYMVLVDDKVVDLTRRQFDPKAGVPWVASMDDAQKDWGDVSVVKRPLKIPKPSP